MILADTFEYCEEGVAMLFYKGGFYLRRVIGIHERDE
jgi:hypothetical protein